MKKLPKRLINEWNKRKGPVVFATVDKNGVPNMIYASCVSMFNESAIVVADNYFDKTKRNVLYGRTGAILFITGDDKSYQVKGNISYHKDGPVFDFMKKWNPPEHPGKGAVSIEIREVYSGSEKLM